MNSVSNSFIMLVFLVSLLFISQQLEASHPILEHLLGTCSYCTSTSNDDDPYRTGYHFQPAKNWMNDPNGPMIYNGIYHLFYQYNPYGPTWGNITWGHSTSMDLVSWTPQPIALQPSMSYDIEGCWSGSITLLPGDKPTILYTGFGPQEQQTQCLAMPKNLSDPYLKEWVKVPQNPLMYPTPENKINPTWFRDPTTAWLLPDGRWRTIIGSRNGTTGLVILYTSEDFIHWTLAKHPLHSAKKTGMWECPDFYPVFKYNSSGVDLSVMGDDVKHVLKVSLFNPLHDVYTLGSYDDKNDRYVPDKGMEESESGLRYDYGKFYASKSFFDSSKQRRILWAWINESSTTTDDQKKGWSGIQGVPRTIFLDSYQKQLVQWPIEEIEMLREKPIKLTNKKMEGGSTFRIPSITAAQADVEVSFEISDLSKAEKFDPMWTNPQLLCSQKGPTVKGGLGPFGLLTLASECLQEYTAVFFRIFKNYETNKFVVLMCSDQTKSSLNPTTDKTPYGTFVDMDPIHEELSLRTLIDHSVIESFGAKGKNCITARIYPLISINKKAHLYTFNNGTEDVKISKLTAWSMKTAHIK